MGRAEPLEQKQVGFFFRKPLVWIYVLVILFLSWLNMCDGMALVGRGFPGFGTLESFYISQVFYDQWTGYQHIETLTRLVAVNDKPIQSVTHFYQWVADLPVNTPIRYALQRSNGELVNATVDTMLFTWNDFIRVYLPFLTVTLIHLFMALFIVYSIPHYQALQPVLGFTLVVALAAALFCDFQFYNFRFSVLGAVAYIVFGGAFLYMGLVLNRRHLSEYSYRRATNTVIAVYGLHIILFTVCFYWLMWYPSHPLNPTLQEVMLSMDIMATIGLASLPLLAAFTVKKSLPDSIEKKQARTILTGAILTCTPLVALFYMPQFWSQTQMVSAEWVVLPFNAFPILIAWAMIKHQAFDVEVYIRKILIYYVFTAILLILYAFFSFVFTYTAQNLLGLQNQTTVLFSALLACLLTSRLYERIQIGVDRVFYRQKTDWNEQLAAFETEAATAIEKEKLATIALTYLEHCFHPIDAAFYLQKKTRLTYFGSLGTNWPVVLNSESDGHAKVELTIPVHKNEQVLAWLFLKAKKSESDYTVEEKRYLERFANHFATYLQMLLMSEHLVALLLEKNELSNKRQFINQLASHLSHDFKSPLSSCYALVNKLMFQNSQRNMTPDTLQHELQKLVHCFDKFSHYINLSLDREMLEKGRLILQRENFCPKRVCQESIELHRETIEKAELSINTNFTSDIVVLNGDQMRFEQAVSNLLSNAIKHAKSKIELSLSLRHQEMVLQVQNDGNPIASDKQSQLFQPYTSSSSTGLGLWISQNYIQLMGGEIVYDPLYQDGARFVIQMPSQIVSMEV